MSNIKENIPEVPTLTNVTDVLVFDKGSNKIKRVKKSLLDTEYQNTSSSYLIYRALLTQTSTNAPVATILENTLGGVPVWTRGIAGIYTCTLSGAFPLEKTFIICGQSPNGGTPFDYSIEMTNIPNAFLLFISERASGTNNDGLLTYNPIEIIVYL